MQKKLKTAGLACAALLLSAQVCSAAGFGIYEWSARGNALGGATVGRADDPSAVASNPAGITELEGVQVLGGVTAIMPKVDIRTGSTWTTSEDAVWTPPHLYGTWKINENYSLGIGMFSRFGLGSVVDEDWTGRYNSYEAIIESVSLNPNLAMRLSDQVSIAVGIEAMYLDFSKKKKLNLGAINPAFAEGDAHIQADGWAPGYNLALQYRPCKYSKIGLTYRSPVSMKVRGTVDFSDINAMLTSGALTGGVGIFKDTDAWGTVTLPDSIALGIAIYPIDKLSVEVGAVYTRWSTYDELKINYGDYIYKPGVGLATQTVEEKNWNDVWRFNIGIEYAALDWLDLRCGYVFDQSPVPDDTIDYMIPANDRHLLNGGLGFHWDNWNVDVSYTYLMIVDRDIDARLADGVYEGEIDNANAHVVGLSVGYKF